MTVRTFCHMCGANVTRDVPIEIDGWSLTTDTTCYNDEFLPLSPQQSHYLHTLAKERPHPVSNEIAGVRIGHDAANPANLASMVVHFIRKRIENPPIAMVRGHGYRWISTVPTIKAKT